MTQENSNKDILNIDKLSSIRLTCQTTSSHSNRAPSKQKTFESTWEPPQLRIHVDNFDFEDSKSETKNETKNLRTSA